MKGGSKGGRSGEERERKRKREGEGEGEREEEREIDRELEIEIERVTALENSIKFDLIFTRRS